MQHTKLKYFAQNTARVPAIDWLHSREFCSIFLFNGSKIRSINIPGGRKTKSKEMRMSLHFLVQIIVTLQPLF